LPFGAAIWSTSKSRMLEYPAASFIRFCDNHGLLQVSNRPQWRAVSGGSESYVNAVHQAIGGESVITGFHVSGIERSSTGVLIRDRTGRQVAADHVVIATHADHALNCLDSPSADEASLLSQFEYESNLAILHTDISFMPKRRRAWCSWNYVEKTGSDTSQVSVSYWMNNLQNIASDTQYIVTLNPDTHPSDDCVLRSQVYDHPVFTPGTWAAQQKLWSLQGENRTWFCGSYFGSGFHEDAVQAGFAVAETLGGLARP
jgi:predicted NAD/FAD-binding protein